MENTVSIFGMPLGGIDMIVLRNLPIVLLIFAHGQSAIADVYKCTGPKGAVTYSQLPCDGDQKNITGQVNEETMPYGLGIQSKEDFAKKYSGHVNFSGDSDYENFAKAAAIISVASQKGRDCEWALKVDHRYQKCQDFLAYVVPGHRYTLAASFLSKLAEKNPAEVSQSDWRSVLYDTKQVTKYRQYVLQALDIKQ